MELMHGSSDCAQLHRELRATGANAVANRPALRAHADSCPACAELLREDGALAARLRAPEPELDTTQTDALFAALEAEIEAPSSFVERLRQRSTATRAMLLAAVSVGLALLISLTLTRVDLSVYPLPRLLLSAALLVAVSVAAGATLLRPLHRCALSTRVLAALALLTLAVPTALCGLPAAHADHVASLGGLGAQLVPRAIGCFRFGLSLALLPIGAAWLLDRGGLRRRLDLLFALVGAGALANLILLFHCPLVAPAHKLAGHASISAALALLALVMWRLGLRRRL